MKRPPPAFAWLLLFVLAALMPLAVLFFLPSGALIGYGLWMWMVMMLTVWMIWAFAASALAPARGAGAEAEGAGAPPARRSLSPEEYPPVLARVMDVRFATEEQGVQVFHGPLLVTPHEAFTALRETLPADRVPMVQEDELGPVVVVMPQRVEREALETRTRPWVHWGLLAATLVTTTWAGAAQQGVDLLREPGRFAAGLPYALSLLAILGIHELGHFLMARRRGMRVTPPYFIPVPFALGTFGAFIRMQAPPEDRRTLFDVAVAGPLAGLVVAIPVLIVGLQGSAVVGATDPGSTAVSSSILFALLAKLSLGDAVSYADHLRLGPMAFAGWLGLFITGLNLLPVGQLDGGHTAQALFGRRAGTIISMVAIWSLVLLGLFVWPALLMWAILIFVLAGGSTPVLDGMTPVSRARRWVGFATFALLALIMLPLPASLWQVMGWNCPYA